MKLIGQQYVILLAGRAIGPFECIEDARAYIDSDHEAEAMTLVPLDAPDPGESTNAD
jgi:hypothetical protein